MALKNQPELIKIIDAIECIEKSLSCAICLEISSEPVETLCGHLFCRICIQKVLSRPGESCPICKLNLTRRSVLASSHMGLCIQQLSKLIDAVRSDTNIDIASCLKTQYKKRAFLPSVSSSSPPSQQEIQNQIPNSEFDNDNEKNSQNCDDSTDLTKQDSKASKQFSVEYPFQKSRKQANTNLSSKTVTKKLQLDTNLLRLTTINPSPVQNENVLLPEDNSGAFNKSKSATKHHQLDAKVNDETDKSFEENRQCLKDISTLNLNRSLSDQSTKTWSCVAKFGKELRRKSGKNSPRIHKKPKLSVNVRDKKVLLNASHDHSTDREKDEQNRVDHDTDANNSMPNRHEDDINVSVDEIKKTGREKINPVSLNHDDEKISKNKKLLMSINNEICDKNDAFEPYVETNERLSDSASEISGTHMKKDPKKIVQEKQKLSDIFQPSDSPEKAISVHNIDKQLSEGKGQVVEASSTVDSGKSLFSANQGSKKSSKGREKDSDASLKANSETLIISENKSSKLSEDNRQIHSDTCSNDFQKLVATENKRSKRLSEERGKIPEFLSTSAGKEAKSVQADYEKINHASEVESNSKRTQYANVAEKVVRFKKLGHLFKVQKKSVAFFYLGSTKSQDSEIFSESTSICKVCSSYQLSGESILLKKQFIGSSAPLNRAKSFESVTFNNQQRLLLPEITRNRIDNGDKSPSHNPCARKKQTIPQKNDLQSRCLSKVDRSQLASTKITEKTLPDESEPSESPINGRKRKRSQSSSDEDQFTEEQNGKPAGKKQSESHDRDDRCMEKQSKTRVSKKLSEASDYEEQSRKLVLHKLNKMVNDKHLQVDSPSNKMQYSQEFVSESPQNEELAQQEKDKTDVNYPLETENVDVDPVEIDSSLRNAFEESNITLRENIPKTLANHLPITTASVPKTVNCTDSRNLIRLEAYEGSASYSNVIPQNSNVHEYEEDNEMDLSRASMMDITGEELLLKNFEEQLFGPKNSENVQPNQEKQSKTHKGCKENTTNCLAVDNEKLMPEPLEQNVSVPENTLVEHNRYLDAEDFIELTPIEQNFNRLNNPAGIIQNIKSAVIQPNIETPQNCGEEKSAETLLRKTPENEKREMITSARFVTKMRPIHESTPKSSPTPTDRYRLTVYRQMNENANSPIRNLADKDISRPLKLIPPVRRQGCILCSGLTSKQSEDVRYLSSLFNMQYTKKFTNDVTHVIVKTNDENNGACKTLKYLQGVVYRKWVLNFNWIVDSMKEKKLLNEELYEVVDSTTLIAGPKKARTGEKGPFDGFVFYCVEPFQNISVPDYEDLLRHMGATVVGSLNDLATEDSIFKIIAVQAECHEKKIIEWHQISKAVPVAQEWIVECISQYRLVSLLPFLQELLPQDIMDLGFPEELIQDDDTDFMYDIPA